MKILFLASESAPFAASGGLGDVMGALPPAIMKTDPSAEVSVMLPLYSSVRENYKKDLVKICDITFNLSWRTTGATIYRIRKNEVNYLFVENHYYFDRGRFYGEYDDGERFAFFCMAALEFIIATGYIPDILHANDWQCALSVIYLKTKYKNNTLLSGIRTVYTIHNIEYQGRFDKGILEDVFSISPKDINILEYQGCLNLMKGAISVSDYITTVSPNYANEIKHDFFSFGLAPVIKYVSEKISGVINGIDYDCFSPEKDEDIYYPYSSKNLKTGKKKNKTALQAEIGLEVNSEIPLIVMVTRLTQTKGIDLVLHILEELLNNNSIQFVILGTGEQMYEKRLTSLSKRYSNMVSLIKFDRILSKKIYAAGDIFLMPSKSEPCGLSQMIACSYGTVPLVRSVGGLCDSIVNWNGSEGNGFRFDNYNAHELLFTIKSMLDIFNTEEWTKLRRNAMKSRFSWSESANKYVDIYNNLMEW